MSTSPRVAICTLSMDRVEYTKRMVASLEGSTSVPFDHYIIDNGSRDGTREFLRQERDRFKQVVLNPTNVGLSEGWNQALRLMGDGYDYLIKVDNDCEFVDEHWLEALIEVCERRGRRIVLSPRVEGLGPGMEGGHPRSGSESVGPWTLGLTDHVGGLCCFAPAAAYHGFRYGKTAMHGYQDVLFSLHVRRKLGWEMGYVEEVRVLHMDTTMGQEPLYPEYFEDRLVQERSVYGEHPAVTAALRLPRRLSLLVKMDRGGLLEGGLRSYLLHRAKARLRAGSSKAADGSADPASSENEAASG